MKSTAEKALVVLAVALMLISHGDAARFEGEISTDFETDMVYVDRFVYQPHEEAILHYDMKVPANDCCSSLVIFRGIGEQWPLLRAMEDEMTCWEKYFLAPSMQNSKVKLRPGIGRPCYQKIDDDGSEIIHCAGTKSFTTFRERWYYSTFMNCHYKRNVGINVRYKLHFLNGDRYWNREFSADESSMLETTLICGILLTVFIIIASIFRVQLANQRKLHITYKLWYVSLMSQFIGVTILTFALFNFAVDGYERSNTKLTGHIFTSIGNVIFTTVLILMGKGFTITRLDIRRLGVAKIVFFVLAYSTTFVTLYILKEKADKRDVKNIYDSEAAFGLIILRFTGLAWILSGVFFTMKSYPKKRAFYLAFTTFAVGWFLSEPFIILLSNYYIPLYCRAKVIHGAYLIVAVLGHAMFLFLTRPSTTNTFFPFHLSTNKVGFEETDEESCVTNSEIVSDTSYTKYMVEKEQAMNYDRTLETPPTIQTISKFVSKQDVKISCNIQETPKPTTLTPLQKVFRALEEVDRSIEADKAAELAQRRKLQAVLGCKIGGIYDMEEELSEESISPSKEVTDGTSSARDSNNHPKNAASKDTHTTTALSGDEKPSNKKTITKGEAAKIKAKELQDIFVTKRPTETKATHDESSTPNKTTVDTSPSSDKTKNQHLPSSTKSVTATTSSNGGPSLTSQKGKTKKVSPTKVHILPDELKLPSPTSGQGKTKEVLPTKVHILPDQPKLPSPTSGQGKTKNVLPTKVHILPDEPKLPSPTSGQGDINHLQDYTKTTVITDPKIIVTKKNKLPRVKLHAYHETRTSEELKELFVTSDKAKPSTSNDAGQTATEVNSFDKVTYTPVMPCNADSDQDVNSKSSPSVMSVNVKRSRHQLHSTPVRGTDHKMFHSRNPTVKTFKPSAQDYRLQLGLPPVGENIKKSELHTSISIEDDYSDEPEFESTVIQPATQDTGFSDPFGCGQVGLEIPGKRWVQEHLLGNAPPSVPTFNQLEVLPPDNTHQSMVKKPGNEDEQNLPKNAFPTTSKQRPVQEKESFARIQFRNFHGLDSDYDNLQRAKQKVQHHIQSTTVLKVENKMEQLSSDKTWHHQHSNGVVKTLNKMETLPQNTQHHKQSTTMLKVENEMEHQSSHKTQHQHHPNGVVKTLNKLEQLPPGRSQFQQMHRIGNEVGHQSMNTQRHMQSNTVLKVENEMEQPSSHKPKHHHEHSNGVVKTLNKLEQLPPNTQHHKQSTAMLKVENEMEHQSSHTTKRHQHSNGVVKSLNKMEQLSPTKVKSSTISSKTSAYSASSSHRDVTRGQKFAKKVFPSLSTTAQQHATLARNNFYKRDPTYNATQRQLVREVDETPQSKEECLERLRQLRDELAVAERLEQKTSPSVTTSESSLGSVPDEEGGDTKKKKRRNPLHKARKMLGKKKPSEQGEQMSNE